MMIFPIDTKAKLKGLKNRIDTYYDADDTYKKTKCHIAKSTHTVTLKGTIRG